MYITIDIGGTHIRISSFNGLNPDSFDKKINIPSMDMQNYDFAIRMFVDEIYKLTNKNRVEGLAIAMTGSVNPLKGQIINSDAFPDWKNRNITKDLSQNFDCDVKIENDAVVAGLAEKFYGEAKNNKSLGFIIVGTGVGGVRIQNVQENTLVFPTEFGHLIILADGHKCICGQRGCIEAYSSGKGFKSMYGLYPHEINDEEVWIVTSRYFTQAIMNFLILHPVEILVFGGGLASNKNDFLTKLIKNTELMIAKRFNRTLPEFRISNFRDDAGSIGGLALVDKSIKINNVNYN